MIPAGLEERFMDLFAPKHLLLILLIVLLVFGGKKLRTRRARASQIRAYGAARRRE